LPDILPIFKCFHRGSATAHLTLMCSFTVVFIKPLIQIRLKRLDIPVDFLAEGHLIKFLQNGFMKSLADSVRLWRFGLGLGVVNVIDRQVQLVIMGFGLTTIFCASICQDSKQGQLVLFIDADSGDSGRYFRVKAAIDSGASRPAVPDDVGQ